LAAVLVPLGTWRWQPRTITTGWSFACVAFAIVALDLAPQLVARRASGPAVVAVLASGLHAGLTLLLGGVRSSIALSWLSLSPSGVAQAHAVLGVIGFGSVLAVGIALHVLPAFLRVSVAGIRPTPRIIPLSVIGVCVLATGQLFGVHLVAVVGTALLDIAAVEWGVFVLCAVRRAGSPVDVLGQQIAVSAAALPIAAMVGSAIVFRVDSARWVSVFGVLLIGVWMCGLIMAVSGRLVPRLAALHARRRDRASVTDATVALAVGGGGVLGGFIVLAGAIAISSPSAARLAAIAITSGATVLLLHHLRAAVRPGASASP
jgi:hypothetical protein